MKKLNSKYDLFQFKDGTIIDVTKIDYIAPNIKDGDAEKAIIQMSGRQMTVDKDDEFDMLVDTWDSVKRIREQNEEIALKYLETIDLRINNLDLYLTNK